MKYFTGHALVCALATASCVAPVDETEAERLDETAQMVTPEPQPCGACSLQFQGSNPVVNLTLRSGFSGVAYPEELVLENGRLVVGRISLVSTVMRNGLIAAQSASESLSAIGISFDSAFIEWQLDGERGPSTSELSLE